MVVKQKKTNATTKRIDDFGQVHAAAGVVTNYHLRKNDDDQVVDVVVCSEYSLPPCFYPCFLLLRLIMPFYDHTISFKSIVKEKWAATPPVERRKSSTVKRDTNQKVQRAIGKEYLVEAYKIVRILGWCWQGLQD